MQGMFAVIDEATLRPGEENDEVNIVLSYTAAHCVVYIRGAACH